jgi:hypothetical protein
LDFSDQIAYGDFPMPHRKQPSKGKLASALGGAGLSLSLAGGVSAPSAAFAADIQPLNTKVSREFTLYEEEISDVSLGTFYVFDNEKVGTFRGVRLAQWISCKGGMGGGCGGVAAQQAPTVELRLSKAM